MRFYNPIDKNELFFSSKTYISAPCTQDIYMTFYLLRWTYFNDVNGCRTILINSQLKRILFLWAATRKNEIKLTEAVAQTCCGDCNFIKKEALAQVFSCEFCEISKNTFFYRTPLVVASELRKTERTSKKKITAMKVRLQ